MKRNHGRINRRNFLRGAGGAVLGLPFLEMFAGKAAAAPGDGPQRIISFFHPQGMIMDAWRPDGVGSNFTLSPILEPLAAINPATGAPLSDDCVIISGLNNTVVRFNYNSGGHFSAPNSLFTCMPLSGNMGSNGLVLPQEQQISNQDHTAHAAGASIEQVIAQRMDAPTLYRSVDFCVGSRQHVTYNQTFYGGPDDPIEPEDDPQAGFERLFAGLDVTDPTPLQRLRAGRGSVLDTVSESFNQLNARAGAEDRQRLEAHAEKIRELETRLGGGIALPACEQPTIGGFGTYDPNSGSDAGSDFVAPQMIDMLVMALACDLTRVGSFQFAIGHAPEFAWLGQDIPGVWEGWHGMIHEGRNTPNGRPPMIAAMRWYTEMFAYLLQALASVPEGDGTMLDNTLVLWLSEFGDGDGHNSQNLPAILAGNVCGRLNTGQHLEFSERSIGDLNTTILNGFEYDDQSFGYQDMSWDGPTVQGPLPGVLI